MDQFNATGMSLKDVLQPREVGEPVHSHVLENASEPTPDFEAMRRSVGEFPPIALARLPQTSPKIDSE